MQQNIIKHIWDNYHSEFFFGLVMSVLLIVSAWLSHFIPEDLFDKLLNPALSLAFATLCFFGGVLCLVHHKGVRVRRVWAVVLFAWGAWEVLMVTLSATANPSIMRLGTDTMEDTTMVLACVFAWLLLVYPTEVLRPGWLNVGHALLQLSPLLVLGVLDYLVPADLRWLIGLYPFWLLAILIRHIRRYREWCEEHFSTLDDIDVQWIVRYVMMVMLSGGVFAWLCISHEPARAFTQQWYLMFVLAYTTERVLYRPDPWQQLRRTDEDEETTDPVNAAYRATLDEWMASEKPYLNPDFQLMDLRQVLPMNRTYLSQFINSEYGCSFYHWVNGLRIEEAKRLMTEQPELKMQDIAERCGFASRQTFSRTFVRETGKTPSEWTARCTAKLI